MYLAAIVCVLVWIVIYFTDTIFKSCMFHPYLHTLHKAGITVKPFYLRCFFTQFNRCTKRWSNKIRFLRLWFDIGIILTLFLIFPAIYLLLVSLYTSIPFNEHSSTYPQVLQPAVLGVNIPFSQAIYYLLSLLVCSIIHELGHSLAAARENVPMIGCGFVIFLLIPIAFVDISKELLSHLSIRQKLRIFTAGIWHNIVLACLSFLVLMLSHKFYSLCFLTGEGVSVIDIQQSSLSKSSGFAAGDQIMMVDECHVNNLTSWKSCLEDIDAKIQSGYCLPESYMTHALTQSGDWEELVDCCEKSSSFLCFKFVQESQSKYMCLQVRELLNISRSRCKENSDCGETKCLFPVIEGDERLISILRKNEPSVLYLGLPHELFSSVSLSPWVPSQNVLGIGIIEASDTLLIYLTSFSCALAVLNLIPCPGLDGQWLCEILIDYLFIHRLKFSHRRALLLIVQILGAALLITNIYFAMYKLVIK